MRVLASKIVAGTKQSHPWTVFFATILFALSTMKEQKMRDTSTLHMTKDQVIEAIFNLNLEVVKNKLINEEDGKAWTQEQANYYEREYKQFLATHAKYPEESLSPSRNVDAFWHAHILHTAKYMDDCLKTFGYFLHHEPTSLAASAEEKAQLEANFGKFEILKVLRLETREQAAYCTLSKPVKEEAAYCTLSKPVREQAAYCTLSKPVREQAAYCTLSKPVKEEAAYCTLSKPVKEEAAYCTLSKPVKEEAAYCTLSKPVKEEAAYCTLSKPLLNDAALVHMAKNPAGYKEALTA